jgi:DNA polymerase II small subunit
VNSENISKLNKTNWDDFETSFENEHDKRAKKINLNFLNFLRYELNLLQNEKPLNEKSLLNEKSDNQNSSNIDYSIFKKIDNFDVERDKLEKIKKFDVEILFDYIEPSRKLSVQDFTLYFNKRLQYFTELLANRISSENVMRIDKLVDLYESNTQVTVIGLISEINQTKNGHYMITLEDKSGSISCFINKDKEDLIKQLKLFCLDEGIGIKGKVGKEIIWTDDFIIPSPPNSVELKKTDNEEYIAFISDIHFGAKVFVDEAFQKFVDFLNGETNNEELNKKAKKIKYIVVPGDLIEGIGIYPNQGRDARILSTELQYHEAARWFSQIPKDKCIILIPGNHDTDRLSEPQPKLPYEKAYALYNMPNVISLSNPAIIKLFEKDPSGGIDVFMYHGGSIFYYADKIQELREKGGAKTPEEVIAFLLEKRHLAPSHGSTLYIPDNKIDPLVIRKMPDIFATGHTHKLALKNYKGCTIVSCGCWVEMSDYQEKMGMYPDIGKCTIINTKTRKPQIINFYTEKYKLKKQEENNEDDD